jgi:hypothetical protein
VVFYGRQNGDTRRCIHRGIVLKGLAIHTDRERFCNAIASYPGVLPRSRCSQKAARAVPAKFHNH